MTKQKKPLLAKTVFVYLQSRGVATGGISVYTPKISHRFVHVWDINTCFEIAMTS